MSPRLTFLGPENPAARRLSVCGSGLWVENIGASGPDFGFRVYKDCSLTKNGGEVHADVAHVRSFAG